MRTFVCAAVALVLVVGAAPAKEKANSVRGKLVKCDASKGIICIMVKKDKDDEGTKTEYKINDDTKFQLSTGKGKEPTVLTEKSEIKEKFAEGTIVRLILDEEGKTVMSVTAIPGKKKPKDE